MSSRLKQYFDLSSKFRIQSMFNFPILQFLCIGITRGEGKKSLAPHGCFWPLIGVYFISLIDDWTTGI